MQNKPNPPYIVFDIGGTNMRLGLVQNRKQIEKYKIVPTPVKFEEGMEVFFRNCRELLIDDVCGACAGGIAGSLNRDKSVIYLAPHLKDWSGKPLKSEISKILGCPVFLENDTAMVGLGEATQGTGRGFEIVCYVTISTGVNGVRVVNGSIDHSVQGFEIGHQIIDVDKSITSQFGRGELEDFISGYALKQKHLKDPLQILDNNIWQEVSKYLAYGLHNTILHWSPEIVILGGSLMKKLVVDEIRNNLKSVMKIFPEIPRIERSALGELGGLYGGLAYLSNVVI